jgi:hypothetical protein
MGRDLAIGIGSAVLLLWLTFFATAGTIEVATLAATVATLVWVVGVDPRRLVDERGNPRLLLATLAAAGVMLVLTSLVMLRSGTLFLALAVVMAAVVVGAVRAVRFRMRGEHGPP